ncbi:hypothetical protein A2U01_0091130, partial [Trifolium medium]|nr:hypothetical protein [Trifolium medium]
VSSLQPIMESSHKYFLIEIGHFDCGFAEPGQVFSEGLRVVLANGEQAYHRYFNVLGS